MDFSVSLYQVSSVILLDNEQVPKALLLDANMISETKSGLVRDA